MDKFICYADDDGDDREFFQEALDAVCPNATLKLFDSATALLNFLEKSSDMPDAIFVDINMPVVNGVEFLKAVRLLPRRQVKKIIMLTTGAEENIVQTCRQLGATMFIQKSTHYKGLVRSIAYALKVGNEIDNWDFLYSERQGNGRYPYT